MKKFAKKIICIVLVAATIATIFAMTASAGTISYGAGTVSASCLNIRSGASTSYSIAGTMSKGTRVVILEKTTNDWYHINYNGLKGYVAAQYLTNVLTVENFNATGSVTGSSVRLRSGPSLDSGVIATYNAGTVMKVTGINNGWYKLNNNGVIGYMRSDYVEIVSNSNAPSTSVSLMNTRGGEIAQYALQFNGYNYVYGGSSPSGFDCSGLVYYVFGKFGYSMSRRASHQYAYDGVSVSKSELQPGDLVFFSDDGYGVTHVGIFIGGTEFIHASTSRTGVIISDLSTSYYQRVWWGAKRMV